MAITSSPAPRARRRRAARFVAPRCKATAVAAALAAAVPALALAQTVLPPVTVTGRLSPPLAVGGWGDTPLERTPISASTYGEAQLRHGGATRIADVTRLDPAVSDSYNSEGYWDTLTIRGFVTDNRFNFRRDGLPINAETSIPLDNKQQLEVLKGLSGLQAGTSAPGGLVNLVVKRPLEADTRSVLLGWRESNSRLAAADLNQRFGHERAIGLRLNVAYEHLDPHFRATQGHRHLLAAAGEWKLPGGTVVEAEVETSRRAQPSVVGFSLLGDSVPDPKRIDPRLNLNHQPWTQPVVFDAHTASVRISRPLGTDWRASAHLATQRLRTDDRTAFPFGVYDPATFACGPCDRFAPDGSFTYWEYISDDERRRSDALDVSVAGRIVLGGSEHRVQAGVLRSLYRARPNQQVFDIAGTGHVDGTAVVPRSSGLLDENTRRDEASTETYLRDEWRLSAATALWLGARHTQLARRSVRTDGSRPTDYRQSFTTPFVALTHELRPGLMAYASWGRGVESEVAPNRTLYTNAGQPLPSLQSRQTELGLKGEAAREGHSLAWSAALFDIERPLFTDIGTCSGAGTCTRQVDGTARHRGIELAGDWRAGAWTLAGGAQWLRARREGAADPSQNGLKPVNVAERSVKLQLGRDLASIPGLAWSLGVVHEGPRMALPDNRARIEGWTRLDALLRYRHAAAGRTLTWRLGVDNLTDERAWKESPYQFGHAYLFPLAPRTWRVSVQADL